MPQKNDFFEFNREKAIEAIIYLASKSSNPTFHSINKLLYFADKTSLEQFGRFICGETYVAMPKGPVPSNVYAIMKAAESSEQDGFVVENNHHVKPLREADLDKLSDSDIECLDKILDLYGNAPYWVKDQASHDAAYWEAWNKRGDKNSIPMSVESIAHLLEDSEELIDYLHSKHDG